MVGSALSGETDLLEAEPPLQSTEETNKETDGASAEKSDVGADSEQQAEDEEAASSSPEDEQPGEAEKDKSEQVCPSGPTIYVATCNSNVQ